MESIEQILSRLCRKDRQNIAGRATRWQELNGMLGERLLFDIYPDFKSYYRDDIEVLQALEQYSQEWWGQGLWCFIDRLYLACITCMAFALETSLKHRLISNNPNIGARYALKKCIGTCQNRKYTILPSDINDPINVAAKRVLNSRDDIAHANIALSRPQSIIYFEGDEHEITGDSSSIQFIEEFKNLARQTILDTKKVIDYLVVNV